VHCATLAMLCLFGGLLFCVACSARGGRGAAQRREDEAEQSRGAQEMARSRLGGSGRSRGDARRLLSSRSRVASGLPPHGILLRGVGPHTGYGRRGKATAGVSGSGRLQKGRRGLRLALRSSPAETDGDAGRKAATATATPRTQQGIIPFVGVARATGINHIVLCHCSGSRCLARFSF
jgi:hypothetical protein